MWTKKRNYQIKVKICSEVKRIEKWKFSHEPHSLAKQRRPLQPQLHLPLSNKRLALTSLKRKQITHFDLGEWTKQNISSRSEKTTAEGPLLEP